MIFTSVILLASLQARPPQPPPTECHAPKRVVHTKFLHPDDRKKHRKLYCL